MEKELNSKFDIKLNFSRDTENPSRLFRSFAEMIEGVNSLDDLIARSINSNVKSKIILDDIEKGSIVGKLWSALILGEDGQIDNELDSGGIEEYIEESRAEALQFIADKKSSVEELKNLKNTISQIADAKDISKSFNYAELDILNLAKSINSINDSTDNLNEKENFEIKSKNKEVKDIISGTSKIDIEAVEQTLTENEIINKFEIIYLIKKPDFLGDSAWSFKHGNKSVNAKILHDNWLEEFHSGKIPVAPGDSLKVIVKQTSRYDGHGICFSDKLEVIKVINVIHNN